MQLGEAPIFLCIKQKLTPQRELKCKHIKARLLSQNLHDNEIVYHL